jgi:uncharacterized protein involved in type VI secretion and phage assembly
MSIPAKARTFDKRFYGVVSGIVVDNEDPDKEGRVKLRYRWFDEKMVSEWARVNQLYAGNGYGALFVPEKDDEVAISFLHGDMRQPIVLGGLYNGKDKPPSFRQLKKDPKKDEKIIKTKKGHTLVLDDTPSKEKVKSTTAGGHFFELVDDDQKDSSGSTSEDDKKKRARLRTKAGHLIELIDQDKDDQNQKIKRLRVRSVKKHELLMDDADQKERVRLASQGGHVAELHDKDKDGKQFVSLTSKAGHALLLDDQDGQQKVKVTTKAGHSVTLDDDGKKVTVTTKGGRTIVLDDDANKITITGATVTLDADTVLLGGSGASHQLILGDSFMDFFNAHQHTTIDGATTPPIVPMEDALLSSVAKTK